MDPGRRKRGIDKGVTGVVLVASGLGKLEVSRRKVRASLMTRRGNPKDVKPRLGGKPFGRWGRCGRPHLVSFGSWGTFLPGVTLRAGKKNVTTGPCHLPAPLSTLLHPKLPCELMKPTDHGQAPPVTSQCKGHTGRTVTEGPWRPLSGVEGQGVFGIRSGSTHRKSI